MSIAESTTPYVFISYATTDRARVLEIVDALHSAGITCWVDQHDVAGGVNWGGSIADAIERCAALVLMSTASSLASRNVRQELALAWQHHKPYLPLLLNPGAVPNDVAYWLATAQWIEVFDYPDNVWLPKVKQALVQLGLPPSVPTAPRAETLAVATVAVPAPLTPTIGREAEITDISTKLESMRLVTLIGPGGTGKTRLAQEVALHVRSCFPDGVLWVDLTPISDPSLVISTIAPVVGVKELAGQSLLETLAHAIGPRHLLLVLDNLEQVVDAAADISTLLRRCPRLSVLATSRVALRVTAEQKYPVSPLRLPDHGTRLEQMVENAAVTLFVQRAQAVRPAFAPTPQNVEVVAAICRRLDGLPLAIELAAARINVLSPQALLARIEHPLDFLGGGSRDLPERQQTLRRTIQWSIDLLSLAEQRLFRRLAVFVGGWTLESAEGVLDVEGNLDIDVLDGLGSLTEKSLVVQTEQPDGEIRFSMLETIREFAGERFAEDEQAPSIYRAHAAWFLTLAEPTAPRRHRGDDAPRFQRLEMEHDNLRNALRWTRANDPELALQYCVALSGFWESHGHYREGRTWIEDALSTTVAGPRRLRARASIDLGMLELSQGDFDLARAHIEQGVELVGAVDDDAIIDALMMLGKISWFRGEYD
nr:TIR domain-containing protein [Chloroflexia bacterium]